MNRSIISLIAICVFFSTQHTFALQEEDYDLTGPLKSVPPTMLEKRSVENGFLQINWLEQQFTRQLAELEQKTHETEVMIAHHRKSIAELKSSLPIEFQFVDQRARADVVGRCLQEILEARLELATLKALTKSSDASANKVEVLQARLQVERAQLMISNEREKLVIIAKNVDQLEKQHKAGVVPMKELDEAKLQLAEAEGKLKLAEYEYHIAQQMVESQNEPSHAETHAQIKAMEARELAAIKFLNTLNQTADAGHKIEQLEETIGFHLSELADLKKKTAEIEFEISRGRNLIKQVKDAIKNPEKFKVENDN